MAGLTDRYPTRVWIVLLGLVAMAMGAFFVPPSVGLSLGLSLEGHVLAIAAIELVSALGITAVVIYHREPDPQPTEWRFDP